MTVLLYSAVFFTDDASLTNDDLLIVETQLAQYTAHRKLVKKGRKFPDPFDYIEYKRVRGGENIKVV